MNLRNLAKHWVLPFADIRQLATVFKLPSFFSEFTRYRALEKEMAVPWAETYPLLRDRVAATPFDGHYFYQSAWLSRALAETRPEFHVDIGSAVNMHAVLSAAVKTVFLDYRPLDAKISGLVCVAGTATSLPFADRALSSVSCLHVVEHIGLGRYGDPLDPHGSRTALSELARVLAPNGLLYISVPVGRERVCFNAHRVFSPNRIVDSLKGLKLVSFAFVDDANRFLNPAPLEAAERLDYGCGMFTLVRTND